MTDDYGTIDAGMSTAGIHLTSADLANLKTAGKWGRFISIVILVSIGLMMLGIIFFGGTMMALASSDIGAAGALGGTAMVIFYGLLFALYIYPTVMLYKFSTNIIKAADNGNATAASEAFASLKSMFKFMGILMAIMLGFYALFFVIALLGGLASMF
jgi:hypothetical protein